MSKHKSKRPVIWLAIVLAVAYYIVNPGRVNKVFDRISSSEQVEELKELAKIDTDFKFSSLNQSDYETYLFPKKEAGKEIIKHYAYSLQYDEKHEQADWVAYLLTKEHLSGNAKRKDNFRADKSVSTHSANVKDYKNSGYDRGHLAPAADMKWSDQAMSESFFMSNMSPQKPRFNRGIWKDLELQVRKWADKDSKLFIVTGPILTDELKKTIGDNKVTVPDSYYKVILDIQEPEIKAIGLVIPNKKGEKALKAYSMSVDEVERLTGIDFFERLPNKFEDELESKYNPELWW